MKPLNDKFKEFGERIEQGKRNDLNVIRDEILAGKTVDEITMENPMLYHQYGRTLSKIEDIAMRKKYRSEMTTCEWLYGETGTGKSHKAFNGYTPESHYVVNLGDKGWWEGYTQQDTVIINDFRGEIPYNQLLQMIDKWAYSVPRRCREPMPFTSKHIIITSSLEPKKIYKNREAEDDIKQLMRRIKLTKLGDEKNGSEVNDEKSGSDVSEEKKYYLNKVEHYEKLAGWCH